MTPASPMLTAAFAEAVQTVRGGVVRIGSPEMRAEGLTWFVQERRRGQAEPVGFGLSDFQGPTSVPDRPFDVCGALRCSRFATYDFDHLIDGQGLFARWYAGGRLSPYMDLTRGMQGYEEQLLARSSKLTSRLRRQRRMIERDIGPVEVKHGRGDADDLRELIERKRYQYQRTGRLDALSDPWKRNLLEKLRETQSPECAGVLSLLRAGDEPLAWHFGLRGIGVFHYWFPVHENARNKWSPGSVLLLEIAQREALAGTRTIDLGSGDAEYKQRFATGARAVYSGSVTSVPGVSLARRLYRLRRTFPT